MGSTVKDFYSGVVLATLLALASCDRGAESAVAEGPAVTTELPAGGSSEDRSYASNENSADDSAGAQARDRTSGETERHKDGAPVWSSNRDRSARENAERAFARNGEDFGARSVDEFIDKAHGFIAEPPRGTLTLTRSNGDKLYYDPKGNIFLVASRDGAPRTMFKPRDGMSYWREQEREIAERRNGGDDRG
jgi:pyocin large subunit-like protein